MPSDDQGLTRKAYFKFNNKHEEARRRRNAASVELRKAKKDDQLSKRRNLNCEEKESNPQIEESTTFTFSLDELIQSIKSSDETTRLLATQTCRKLLSREKNPPINDMIEAGIVPCCIELLDYDHNIPLQFEAAWVLTNIASGTSVQTQTVIKCGAVQKLVRLLKSESSNVAEQAVWALGNIAGDGPTARDFVLTNEAMPQLLELIRPDISVTFLRNIVWTLSNLCRNKNPPPSFEMIQPALAIFIRLLTNTDQDVLADTCWALSYLSDGSNDKIQAILDTGIIPLLVELLKSQQTSVLTPALRTVGNIVTGDDAQTDAVISAGALPHLGALLRHSRSNIVKEAAWAISNITAGNAGQIQHVINANLLTPLVEVLQFGDYKAQKEAAWAVTNLTSGGTVQHLSQLVAAGVLPYFCNLLDSKDWNTVIVVLDGLSNLLHTAAKMGEETNLAILIEEIGALDKLEALQHHENEQVYMKSMALIDAYFTEKDTEEVGTLTPKVEDNNQLQFDVLKNPSMDQFKF
ncbi:importin subunit alpha-1 [Linepithema humile]|uniref:importin subunit alpha-1 n=1 Tax=Linepithema humile TaxID=83485 RepID=UPI000623597C|nr:PREDICTED: importin subunit alpha-1 [Linepithema humile]XP_012217871.1 PREDICTED: importin subunit alpha-1 [Linepithema humile]